MQVAPAIKDYLESVPGYTRVIGPPGSGKTTLLVDRYRALLARGYRPGIIAFGREQQERMLDLVLPPGAVHLGPGPVTTHALIASALLDASRPGRPRTLRDVDELLVLGRLLRREPSLLSSDLSRIAGSPTFLRDLVESVHALAQHGLTPAAAKQCACTTNNPRIRDVFNVYRRYREVCDDRGLVTFYDAAWRAAERFDAGGISSPLAGFDVVLIDDFHDLDPGQYRLLTSLLPPGGATTIEVFGDPTGARFAFRGTSDRHLERLRRDRATTDFELSAPQSPDVALNQTIASLVTLTSRIAPAPSSPDLPLFANAIPRDSHAVRPAWPCEASLVIADDEIAEAQAIAARIRTALDQGTAPRDIAVIARDPARYRSALAMACYEWGVALDAGGDGHGAVEDFVRSLLGALGADNDGRFGESLAASPFHPPLSGGMDGDELVRALRRDYTQRGGGFDLERLVHERVVPLLAPGDAASRASLAEVVDEWKRYGEVVGHAGGGASLDEFRSIYLGEPVHRLAATGRVAFLSPREASGRSFRTVFVCGCAEGYFPAADVRDGYISMAALARALEPVNPDAAADLAARVDETKVERVENALFLTALTRARESLTILCPAKIAGEATVPARVLAADERPFTTETTGRVTSTCARAAAAVAMSPGGEATAAKLREIDALAGWWVSPPPPERLPTMASFTMSPSKLNSYARCPRQFFYRNVLRLEEPESIYLRVGSLVHEALKEIIPVGATGDEVRAALGHAGTREIAERLVSKEMGDAGVWMRDLSVHYLEDMLTHVAELEAQREGSYRVRVQEESVETSIEGMPMRGRFDRIDDVDGLGPVIIDYKTSGTISKTYPTLIDKIETDYWQIPAYATMAAATGSAAAGFVYYVLPPGEPGLAVGVQLAYGSRPAPIPLGKRRPHRYGPVDAEVIVAAMAHAVETHRAIVEGECRYERTDNTGICPNCYFARICQRSKASN